MTTASGTAAELYAQGVKLHKSRRLLEAQQCYRAFLKAEPAHADCLHQLGALLIQRDGAGQYNEALLLVKAAIQLAPSNARYRRSLGLVHEAAQQWLLAADAYTYAVEKQPKSMQARMDLARVLKAADRFGAAADQYKEVIRLQPDHPTAHFKLASVLKHLGRHKAAAEQYKEHLRIDPQSSSAAFWLAALTHDSSAAACPSSLVARMFDQYADHFDQHLVEQLQYKTPLVLMKCIQEAAAIASQGAQWSCCIDLGCGTGLMGPLLRQHVQHLAGIDLSSKMVEKARERGCYDELAVGELAQYLETAAQQGADQAYDLLVAADVFVYIGDLLPVLMAAAATATDRALFAFSTELLQGSSAAGSEQISSVCSPANCSIAAPADSSTQGSSQGPTGDQASTDAMGHYALQATGRYAHSPGYLRSMAAATGWQTLLLKLAVIRFNAGKPIYGNLCVLHRC